MERRDLLAGAVTGVVVSDTNGDGIGGAGDSGLAGAVIYVDANNNGVLDDGEKRSTTAGDGSFTLTDISPGLQYIRIDAHAAWRDTFPVKDRVVQLTDNEIQDWGLVISEDGLTVAWQEANVAARFHGGKLDKFDVGGVNTIDVNEGGAVWDYRGALYYAARGETTATKISKDGVSFEKAQLDGGEIVAMGYVNGAYQLFHIKDKGATIVQLTTLGGINPSFDNGQVVFRRGSAVMQMDLTTKQESRIDLGTTNNGDPLIWNDNVVFVGHDGNDFEVYAKLKDAATKNLSDNDVKDGDPHILTGIAWESNIGNQNEIFWSPDGVAKQRVTENQFNDADPFVGNGQFVWHGWDAQDEDWEIHLGDGSSTRNLTDDNRHQQFPVLGGTWVAYLGRDGSTADDREVYLHPLVSGYQVTVVDGQTVPDVNFARQLIDAPPTLSTSSSTLRYREGDGKKLVDDAVTVADSDSANLTSARVSFASGYRKGEDTLHFTDQNGITGSFDADTGMLTLTGVSSVANYQAALRSITFENAAAPPATGLRRIQFEVKDATSWSNPAYRHLDVVADQDLVEFRFEATDMDGNPISSVLLGREFKVNVFGKGTVSVPQGPAALYLDATYQAELARITDLAIGQKFPNARSGDISAAGLADEVGGFGSQPPLGGGEHLLATFTFDTLAAGKLRLAGDPADVLPLHDILIYGSEEPVPPSRVEYGNLTLDIIGGWQNPRNNLDVNDDALVTPVDVIIVINELNSRAVAGPDGLLPSPAKPPPFYDVNGDLFSTPVDALAVINFLNSRGGGEGEASLIGFRLTISAASFVPIEPSPFDNVMDWRGEVNEPAWIEDVALAVGEERANDVGRDRSFSSSERAEDVALEDVLERIEV